MSQFYSDYTPIWEPGASQSGDFESNVGFETTEQTDTATAPGDSEAGPLVSTVETSGWTTDDVMIGLTALNVVLFGLLVYCEYGGR